MVAIAVLAGCATGDDRAREQPASSVEHTDDPGVIDAHSFQQPDGNYYFRSPSGDFHCVLWPAQGSEPSQFAAACQTAEPSPTLRALLLAYGCRLAVNGSTVRVGPAVDAEAYCSPQRYFYAYEAGALPYGKSIVVNGDWCSAQPTGITCRSGQHGFTISRDDLILS